MTPVRYPAATGDGLEVKLELLVRFPVRPAHAANPAASAEAQGHGAGRFLIFQPGWAAACSAQPGGTGTGTSTMLATAGA